MGHRVELTCLDAPSAPWIADLPMVTYALGPASGTYGYCSRLLPWLKANARNYDCVVVNGCWQYHGLAAWRALHNASTPYVVFPHGMLAPWFKRTYPLKHLKKCLYWPWGEYRVLRDARAVIFACEEEKIHARESFRLYSAKEVVLPLGTPTPAGDPEAQRCAFLERFPRLAGKRIALFLGRIHPIKGCDDLIRAFASALSGDHEWHLVIAGPDHSGLQVVLTRLAEELGVADRITWTGMLTGGVKEGALHAAEIFVLPSHHENFGMVISEALSHGVPVIISDKVNIWREVVADKAGFAANDDTDSIAALLKRWAELPYDEKCEMRRRAYECFRNRFEIGKSVQQFIIAIEQFTTG